MKRAAWVWVLVPSLFGIMFVGCAGSREGAPSPATPMYTTAEPVYSASRPAGDATGNYGVEESASEDFDEGGEAGAAPPPPAPSPSPEVTAAPVAASDNRVARRRRVRPGTPHHRQARPAQPARPVEAPRAPNVNYNMFVEASADSLSTFSLDVDTASYTVMRREIGAGALPSPSSVRVEEYVNFFDYGEAPPATNDGTPFAVHLESSPSQFGENLHLLRVGVQGIEIPAAQRPSANLVFLIDVSGSMNRPDKLPLVQFALTTLVNTLRPDDTIGIVVYSGRDAVLLEPTPVLHRGALLDAIAQLRSGGSTAGEAGIRRAYDLAAQHIRPGGINRVILATDGDFNVGLTGEALIRLIERYRERDIALTVLGFGRGCNDRDLEQLADRGNGSYAFVDSRNEALRVLQRNLAGTLQVIAQDVKVQVIFDSEIVSRFRLIGYENRVLRHQDFDNDAIDAAEIGSGQFVTAYLEYELREGVQLPADGRQLALVRLRYKRPGEDQSIERRYEFATNQIASSFGEASPVFRFGAAVAEFAEIVRRSPHSQGARFDDIVTVAQGARFNRSPDVQEFIQLVTSAREIWQRQQIR